MATAPAGPSTPLLAKCASYFAQDDTSFGVGREENKQRQEQQQKQRRNAGSLHSAVHDKAVNSSGRDDDFFVVAEKRTSNSNGKSNGKARTTAKARTKAEQGKSKGKSNCDDGVSGADG
jgi:hypothetical protein